MQSESGQVTLVSSFKLSAPPEGSGEVVERARGPGLCSGLKLHALLVARSPRGYVWQFRFSCLFPAAGTGLWKGVNSQKEERWGHNESELRLRDPVAQCSIRGLASQENLKQARLRDTGNLLGCK